MHAPRLKHTCWTLLITAMTTSSLVTHVFAMVDTENSNETQGIAETLGETSHARQNLHNSDQTLEDDSRKLPSEEARIPDGLELTADDIREREIETNPQNTRTVGTGKNKKLGKIYLSEDDKKHMYQYYFGNPYEPYVENSCIEPIEPKKTDKVFDKAKATAAARNSYSELEEIFNKSLVISYRVLDKNAYLDDVKKRKKEQERSENIGHEKYHQYIAPNGEKMVSIDGRKIEFRSLYSNYSYHRSGFGGGSTDHYNVMDHYILQTPSKFSGITFDNNQMKHIGGSDELIKESLDFYKFKRELGKMLFDEYKNDQNKITNTPY